MLRICQLYFSGTIKSTSPALDAPVRFKWVKYMYPPNFTLSSLKKIFTTVLQDIHQHFHRIIYQSFYLFKYLNNTCICSLSLIDSRLRSEDLICCVEIKVCTLYNLLKKSLGYSNYVCMFIYEHDIPNIWLQFFFIYKLKTRSSSV